MGATEVVISSHHHQAVDELGDGVVAVAWAEDGTLEGIEVAGDAWIVGAQWHPEDTAADDPTQQALFDELVARSRGVSATSLLSVPPRRPRRR
jgi:putative glutamine amidotransferase